MTEHHMNWSNFKVLSVSQLPFGLESAPVKSDRRNEADHLLESLGISTSSRDSTPAPRSDRLTETSVSSPKIVRKAPTLTMVSLQSTTIPPKESVTYNKETQTATGSERERDCEYKSSISGSHPNV
jgi:hypothetical protein